MARGFFTSKLWQGILTRLGLVETQQGTLPAAVDYNTIAEIRAETTHVDEDRIQCLENQITYQFEATSTAADDGFAVLKPTNIAVGDPGRWLMEFQLALKNHTHAEKANVVATPTQTRFLVSNATGHPVESTSTASSFAAASHTHAGYATTAEVDAVEEDIVTITEALTDKMDKYPVQAGDIGKVGVFDANGNCVPGSGAVRFDVFYTGALTKNVRKSCAHNLALTTDHPLIGVRNVADTNNMPTQELKPTPATVGDPLLPYNSIDIIVLVDIPAPGLLIQICGS